MPLTDNGQADKESWSNTHHYILRRLEGRMRWCGARGRRGD